MPAKLLTCADVADRLNVTKLTVYRHIKDDPDFPPPIRISTHVLRFDPDDVEAYISSRRQRSAA